jgi:hypothetical protein
MTNDVPSQPFNHRLSDPSLVEQSETGQTARDSVLFKNDRIYRHQLVRFNYTTYDVRRSQDVVNPNTSHRDIMLLANPDDLEGNANHPFLYARVVGIFHANVIYTGPGMLDHFPRKLDFLWVRWFQYCGSSSVIWKDCRLDCVRFPPTASDGAFGFVDPRDVLRGCHIMPRFAKGKVHSDGIGLSRCAADSNDWIYYYVNRCDNNLPTINSYDIPILYRFVDRDMTMRYHWGLAVGHVYTRGQTASQAIHHDHNVSSPPISVEDNNHTYPESMQSVLNNVGSATETDQAFNENDSDVDQLELMLKNQDVDECFSDSNDEEEGEDFSDDDMLLAIDDMYGAADAVA